MFDVAPTELLLIALVALVVIGPKDLPRAMRYVGNWVGKARGMARHFRSGLNEMMRQSELDEMENKGTTENERSMQEHPMTEVEGAPAAEAIEQPARRAEEASASPRASTDECVRSPRFL